MKSRLLIILAMFMILTLVLPVFAQSTEISDAMEELDRRNDEEFPDDCDFDTGVSVQSSISEVNEEGVPVIRVRLRSGSSFSSVSFVGADSSRVEIRNGLTNALLRTTNANQTFTIESITTGVRIPEFNLIAPSFRLIPQHESGRVRVSWPSTNARNYRGYLEVEKVSSSSSNLKFINTVTLEEYLYGVVPNEMMGSWHQEALKAQAITARTFALANINNHSHLGYNLCDSSACCQAYLTSNPEHSNSTNAVDQTKGQVGTHNGKLISTFYSSSTGGYTESYYNWGGSTDPTNPKLNPPHLQSVPDPYDAHPNNSRHSWTRVFTLQALTERFSNYNVGQVESIEATKPQTESGRQMEITVRGTGGEYVISGQSNIRKSSRGFGLWSAKFDIITKLGVQGLLIKDWSDASALPAIAADHYSCEVTIDGSYVIGAAGKKMMSSSVHVIGNVDVPSSYEFIGGGWGHGVGMSQWGALGMASDGKTCEEILQHYYQGIEIENAY